MAFEKYTVRQFEKAWFDDDRSVMDEYEFKQVHTEYMDTSGLFENEEFDKVCYIYWLNNRINSIKLGITLQKEFLKLFSIPYKPAFSFFVEFGHNLKWNDNVDDFEQQLFVVETREKMYIGELEGAMNELKEIRNKRNKGETPTTKKSRSSFIRTRNTLGKIGYPIDPDKTTVEEMALMIKQQSEEAEQFKNRQQ